ncbi:hypothetical protein Tco_0852795 [Tanacetum coccineum]
MSRTPPLSIIDKVKSIATPCDDSSLKTIMPYVEQSGLTPNLSHFKHFRAADEPLMTLEEATQMVEEHNTLANFKKAMKYNVNMEYLVFTDC